MKTNLAQQPSDNNPDYFVGDVVVFRQDNTPHHLMTVSAVAGHSVLLNGSQVFSLKHLIRIASIAELKSKRRLDPPVALFISGES